MKDKIISYLIKNIKIEVGVIGIIIRNGKIMLTKRSKLITEGEKWCLPGGHVNKWEKAEDALKREIKEEIGYDVEKSRLLFVYEEFIKRLNIHAVTFAFLIEIKGKEKNNWEVSETKWFNKKEIEKLDLAFDHKGILEKFWRMK